MPFTATACRFEKKLVSLLEEAGFEVVDHRREELDLRLSIERDGERGRVWFLGGVTAAKGVKADPDPKFVRIDLGEPTDEPTSWFFWAHEHEHQRGNRRSYSFAGVQAAIGPNWSSVALGSMSPSVFTKVLIAHVEKLKPSESDESRVKYVEEHQLDPQEAVSASRGFHPLSLLVAIPLFAILATVALWNEPVDSPQFLAFSGFLALGAILVSGLGLLLWRLGKRDRPIAGGGTSLVEDLRACGAFETVEAKPPAPSTSTRVIVSGEPGLDVDGAEVVVTTIRASSTKHEVSALVTSCEMSWPEGVRPTCQVVPGRWLTLRLDGPDSLLIQLDEVPRIQSESGKLVSTMRGDEYESGVLDVVLKKLALAAAKGGASGPYR